MGSYALVLIIILMILGILMGVTTRFYSGFGENIAKNCMKDLGLDDKDMNQGQDDEE